MGFRVASAVVGAWLALTPIIWQSTPTRGFMDLVVGTLLLTSGICGAFVRSARFFDAALGVVLVLSFFAVDSLYTWQAFHDAGVGVLVLVLAALGGALPGTDAGDHWVRTFDLNPRLPRGAGRGPMPP